MDKACGNISEGSKAGFSRPPAGIIQGGRGAPAVLLRFFPCGDYQKMWSIGGGEERTAVFSKARPCNRVFDTTDTAHGDCLCSTVNIPVGYLEDRELVAIRAVTCPCSVAHASE